VTILGNKLNLKVLYPINDHPDLVQPHLPIGLDDQRIILNKLYDLVLKTTKNQEELECSWQVLAQQELPTRFFFER
jgi:hypothetical protein